MSDYLWTICFAATGFVLVVQHYRIQRLEITLDGLLDMPLGKGRPHD